MGKSIMGLNFYLQESERRHLRRWIWSLLGWIGLCCFLIAAGSDSHALGAPAVAAPKVAPMPATAGILYGVVQVAPGYKHTCALLGNGAVKCWGSNQYGQLGNGANTASTLPVDVSGLSNVTAIASGDDHTCALLTNHTVQCWGRNENGQLGDGSTTHRNLPVTVGTLTNVTTLAAGGWLSCALVSGGGARCWGFNGHGALGDGTTTNRPTPVTVNNLSGATAITMGGAHVCVIMSDNTVQCWGNNSRNQLGDGSNTPRFTPGPVSSLTNVAKIAAGRSHTCALISSGTLQCWGSNIGGQLGDGTTTNRSIPVSVAGLSGVTALAGGSTLFDPSSGHTCALLNSGLLKCWGLNDLGQLGDGTTDNRVTPGEVSSLNNVTGVGIGVKQTCALAANGLSCWGENDSGQLGHSEDNKSPHAVVDLQCYSLSFTPINNGGSPQATPAQSNGCASGSYVGGETITLQANPNPGWTVKAWSGADNAGAAATNVTTMPSFPHAVTVEYLQNCYTLTLTKNGEGSVPTATPAKSANCPNQHDYVTGEAITLSASPAQGWQVSGWTGADNTSPSTTVNLTMPAGNRTATVIYAQTQATCFILTLTHSGQGSDPTAVPDRSAGCPVGEYNAGATVTVSASPASGWAVAGWQGTANDSSTATTNSAALPAAAHTINITYVESVQAGDAYETDDTCGQAKALTVDSTAQERTYHRQADVDWMFFNATANTVYRIEVKVPTASPADVNLEIYTDCSQSPDEQNDPSFSPDIRLDFQAAQTGPIYVRLANYDATVFGDDVRYQLSVRALSATNSNKALIIVAGRLRGADRLQKNIHNVTTSVYQLFQKNDYDNDDIHYLATDTQLPGYDAAATKDALRNAITGWAAGRLQANGVLTLYLVDHGHPERFYLDELNGQSVTPTELDEWLTTLENSVPTLKINIFIEACQSGSFIDKTEGSLSKPGRVIVTSTDATNDAKASQEGAYFSDHFLTALYQGATVANSFQEARNVARDIFALQQAWLDADGDGEPNEFEDATISAERSFAFAGTLASNQWAPHIFEVQPPTSIEKFSGVIRADVRDDVKVRQVWAIVYSPDYETPTTIQELQAETLPNFNLTPTGEENQYAGLYPGFTQKGLYRIVIQAVDNEGLVASPRTIEVDSTGNSLYLPTIMR